MKKILTVFLMGILCLILSACGHDGAAEAPETLSDMVKLSDDSTDYSDFRGTWKAEENTEYDLIEIYAGEEETRFEIQNGDDIAASGYLQYMEDYAYVYAYNEHDGVGYRCSFDENGVLTVSSFGTFKKADSSDNGLDSGTDNGVSALSGNWYLDGDANADSIIEIDESGNWRLYERPNGDGDPQLIDEGSIAHSGEEGDIYIASSDKYDGVKYQFGVADENTVYWGGENDCYIRAK